MTDIDQEEFEFLALWAARNGAALRLEGECGFGRECVGITKGDHYPAWRDWDRGSDPFRSPPCAWVVPEAEPPGEVIDAYHKSDVLAVLGRGPDAVHQLYLWVKHLDEHGISIKTLPREPENPLDALVHGLEQHVLTRAGGGE